MKKKLMMMLVALAGAAALYGAYTFQVSRLTPARLAQVQKATQEMQSARNVAEAQAKAAEAAASASAPADSKENTMTAPASDSATGDPMTADVFRVNLKTSKGDVVVECHRDWAPNGVDRFRELVKIGFFDDCRFFRVVKKPRPFVVQFGINGDPKVMAKWRNANIADDPVKQSNVRGTLCFAATGAPNSRSTQLFINLNDNSQLDGMRFAVIGKIVSGMEFVDAITDEYGEAPDQGMIQTRGNEYLKAAFPNLDYIEKATLVQ